MTNSSHINFHWKYTYLYGFFFQVNHTKHLALIRWIENSFEINFSIWLRFDAIEMQWALPSIQPPLFEFNECIQNQIVWWCGRLYYIETYTWIDLQSWYAFRFINLMCVWLCTNEMGYSWRCHKKEHWDRMRTTRLHFNTLGLSPAQNCVVPRQ